MGQPALAKVVLDIRSRVARSDWTTRVYGAPKLAVEGHTTYLCDAVFPIALLFGSSHLSQIPSLSASNPCWPLNVQTSPLYGATVAVPTLSVVHIGVSSGVVSLSPVPAPLESTL